MGVEHSSESKETVAVEQACDSFGAWSGFAGVIAGVVKGKGN